MPSTPSSFSTTAYDFSSRTDVGTSVNWTSVPTRTPVNSLWQSPDISTLVQEVVHRTDWGSGKNIVFLIEGTGVREAKSHEGAGGTSSYKPMLHVAWTVPEEECDDGNTNNGDGCSSFCQTE